MTRISTYSQNQTLIQTMLWRQEAVADDNRRIATGKEAPDFKSLSREGASLLSAKSIEARFEASLAGNHEISLRLQVYNSSLDALAEVADQFRHEIVKATANNSGLAFMNTIDGLMERAAGLLNTEVDDRYIFGGTRTDQAPITATNRAELLAEPTIAGIFKNNGTKLSAQLDAHRSMEYGIVANEIATPLMNAFKRIMQFSDGTLPPGAGAYAPAGAFSEPLTDNQRQYLQSELLNVNQSIETLRSAEASNGVKMDQLETIAKRQSDDLVFWRTFISEIEDVNLTEVIAKLNDDRVVLEASIQVVARLSRLSLLDFI